MIADYEEAAQSITGFKPQENTKNQNSTSFSFSLQILAHEGFSVKGDIHMQKTATIPSRASKPAQVTPDVEQKYDDDTVNQMPRSAVRFRSTQSQETKSPTTGPIVAPVTQRVSGNTRFLLWVLLMLCIAFVINGVVIPAIHDVSTQLQYGDSKIATYDLNGKHWITEESNGRLRLIDSNPDGSHSQQLTTNVANAPKHGLVMLKENGQHVDVYINDAFLTYLVADGRGGYKWGSN